MKPTKHIHHYHRHMSFSYPVSIRQRLYSMVLIPVIILALVFFVIKTINTVPVSAAQVNFGYILSALATTFVRLLLAYFFALILAIPLALFINHSPKAERVLLPLFDIIQSVPILAFFPVIILFFVHYHFYNGAAIFILLITMMWSIVFSIVGGLRGIPQDIKAAAQVFNVKGLAYVYKVLLPAVFPYIVTGSLLAWAGGWNIVIVAEVLHTYIPNATSGMDLFGIGSLLVQTAASGNSSVFFESIACMVLLIGVFNFFVWQKLLHFAERFKFE